MRVLYTATQHGMNPTRAFGAPLYRGFLHLLVYLSGVAVLHTRRGRVMPTVGVHQGQLSGNLIQGSPEPQSHRTLITANLETCGRRFPTLDRDREVGGSNPPAPAKEIPQSTAGLRSLL